jgi:hypothetical protein
MKAATLGVVAVSALALVACHPKPLKRADLDNVAMDVSSSEADHDDDDAAPLKVLTALDCPESEGELTRTAVAGDGRSCDYSGPGEETVHLSLAALDGRSVLDTVAPLKAELKDLVHVSTGGPVSVEAGGDHAKVDLPFLHVDADGDKAKVKLFGINIDADGDHATVRGGPGMKNAVVHAGPGGAEVLAEDVGKSNASLVYILAGDAPGPSGYRSVGYVARGPVSGPLVIGEFKSKAEHHGDRHNDLDRLIERNVRE